MDMAAAAAFVAQLNAQSLQQQQQHMGMSSEQASVSMAQPMAGSLSATGAPAPSLPSQMGGLNPLAGSSTDSGLSVMSALPLTDPLAVSGLQPAMMAQQQAAYAAAMGGDPTYAAGSQFGSSISQSADQHYLGMPTATQMMAMSQAHSRTASTVDGGGVAMYSNGDSSSATPRSGAVAGAANMGAQLQHQLQQHQLQQQQSQELLLKGLSANASTAASANQSGAPSPFANTPLPMANQGNPAASIGHRRQQSSSFLTTMQQQQQQTMYVDPPLVLATAPPTLVPGTPTPFGQLQFHLHAPGTATAPHPLGHPHAVHFGHSRHLSLDAANFRLMAADASTMGGFPTHPAIYEHSAEMSQHAAHISSVQQQQQLQQQLHHLQQLQAQQKSGAMAMRTVPATPLPQHPDNSASFNSAPQLTPLGDPMTQHQFQQLQQQQSRNQQQQRQHMFMHHSSASVDLGSLSSAFHPAVQYGQALPGQITPMATQPSAPVGVPMAQMYMPLQFTQLAPPVVSSQVASNAGGSGALAVSPEESEDEDEDDVEVDDDDISGEEVDMDERKVANTKSSKGMATPTSVVSGGPRSAKVPAPYKRF
ncbi:hypothetical protein H4S02_005395, partial [Coemansia sp. RSA 2611]